VLRRRKRTDPSTEAAEVSDDPVGDLVQTFEGRADPSRAEAMSRYMRNEFEFVGLQAPLRRKLAAPLMTALHGRSADEVLGVADQLWALPEREYQYVATDLLRAEWRSLPPESLGRLRELVLHRSWWDTVDPLSHVVGVLVMKNRELTADMEEWLADPNRWLVRVALLHQLGWKGAADPDLVFRFCLARGSDEDFFIRKAIGWALRDLARGFPERVRAFIEEHGDELSPLSVSEATKHL
jgi:3-methyladenine DNA glycosylase AlkD